MMDALVKAMVILILAELSYLQSMTDGMAPNPFADNPAPPLSIPRSPKGPTPNAIPEPQSTQIFDDVPPDYWAYEEINQIFLYGITVGCSYDPPLYCPDRPMTRAEAAVFAARIIELIEGK